MIKICHECFTINHSKTQCTSCGFPFNTPLNGKYSDVLFHDCIDLINLGDLEGAEHTSNTSTLDISSRDFIKTLLKDIRNIQQQAESQFQSAQTALNNRQFKEAERNIKEVLKIYPNNSAYLKLLKDIELGLSKENELNKDHELFTKALKLIETYSFKDGLSIINNLINKYPDNFEYKVAYDISLKEYKRNSLILFDQYYNNYDLHEAKIILDEIQGFFNEGDEDYEKFTEYQYLLNQKVKESSKKNTSKKSIQIILICLVLLGLSLLGYKLYTDYTKWDSLTEPRTINDIRKFINENENNWLVYLAKNALDSELKEDSLSWLTVQTSPSIENVNSYIQSYGLNGGYYFNDANLVLDSLYWEYILYTKDVDTIQSYINKFPYGKHINEANQLLSNTIRQSDLIKIKSIFQSYYQALSNANLELAITQHDVITNKYENGSMITHEELHHILENLIRDGPNFNINMSSFNARKNEDGNYYIQYYLDITTSVSGEQIDPTSNTVIINNGQESTARKEISVILNDNFKIISYISI